VQTISTFFLELTDCNFTSIGNKSKTISYFEKRTDLNRIGIVVDEVFEMNDSDQSSDVSARPVGKKEKRKKNLPRYESAFRIMAIAQSSQSHFLRNDAKRILYTAAVA
jgi:hypothetical protein